MRRRTSAVFKSQAKAVIKEVRKADQGQVTKAITRGIKRYEPKMVTIFKTYYGSMFDLGALNVRRFLKKQDVLENPFEILRAQFINSFSAEKVVNISANTIKRLKGSIRFGLDAGMSPYDLSFLLEDTAPRVLSPGRAETIARTEVHNAFENASLSVAKESEIEMQKTWMASLDGDTRLGHREVDGISVGVNDNFEVPLYNHDDEEIEVTLMEGPGDQSAPAGQVVNCRCTLVFEPMA